MANKEILTIRHFVYKYIKDNFRKENTQQARKELVKIIQVELLHSIRYTTNTKINK